MEQQHVMVDLETLGLGDNSAIIQIGAVRFNNESIQSGIFSKDIEFSKQCFGEIDPKTVAWWMTQEREAQQRVFKTHGRIPLNEALKEFALWAEPDVMLWANSPNFDIRLLRQAFERVWIPWPFSYRNERCYRTIHALGKRRGVFHPVFRGIPHNAVDDAIYQANRVIAVVKDLG